MHMYDGMYLLLVIKLSLKYYNNIGRVVSNFIMQALKGEDLTVNLL